MTKLEKIKELLEILHILNKEEFDVWGEEAGWNGYELAQITWKQIKNIVSEGYKIEKM
jgi:hypothetical protein